MENETQEIPSYIIAHYTYGLLPEPVTKAMITTILNSEKADKATGVYNEPMARLVAGAVMHGAYIYHQIMKDESVPSASLLQQQVEKLQAFKDFVHRRLDEMGIPSHPDGEHSKEGCRIGDRLDIVQRDIATKGAVIGEGWWSQEMKDMRDLSKEDFAAKYPELWDKIKDEI